MSNSAGDPNLHGLAAEFESPEALAGAGRALASAGYRAVESYTPFAIDGWPVELGLKRTRMATIVGTAGAVGAATGFAMQWFANVIHYPWIVGGKPPNSWPMWIPITFECGILFAAVTGVASMLFLNGLPRLYHPMFRLPAFRRASRDRFFLCVQARDPLFDLATVRRLLEASRPAAILEVPR